MRLSLRLLMAFGLCFVVSACSGQQSPTAAPATALPADTPAPVTDAPSPTPLNRATLPPTWTLIPPDTATPEPSPTPDIRETLVYLTPTLEACFGFGEDTELAEPLFTPGERVTIYWTPLPDAYEYEVRLYDDSNSVIAQGLTIANEFSFDGSLFEFERSYYWTVRPFDDLQNQLCPVTGGYLLPTP